MLDRRKALKMLGSVPAVVTTSAAAEASAAIKVNVEYLHGIASGDPLADRVMLWTRITPDPGYAGGLSGEWEISEREDFQTLARSGTFDTGPERDFTVKVDVDGLKPHTDYHYRFHCNDQSSPVGRTRTLPVGAVERLKIAVASCALYSGGLFNAYREISKLADLDLVVHLGDYIYEYGAGPDQWGAEIGAKIGRLPTPAHETVTLADYRERYACHRLDADLQAAHAHAPWIVTWDDHESTNDSWAGGAQNHQPDEGDWATRRTHSIRAFFEWLPIREPAPGKSIQDINRTFQLGNLASLIMVESRHMGRSEFLDVQNPALWQVIDSRTKSPVTDKTVFDTVMQAVGTGQPPPAPYTVEMHHDALRKKINDPGRNVFGALQEQWIAEEVKSSVRAGIPWQLIGNQVVMANTLGVDVVEVFGRDNFPKALAAMDPQLRAFVAMVAQMPKDLPWEFDGWNAFPHARARMNEILGSEGATSVVLSGDSHCFWVNQLQNDRKETVAAEIGTAGITSPSIGDMLGGHELGTAVEAMCEEVLYNRHLPKGFVLLTVEPDHIRSEVIAISTIFSRNYESLTLKQHIVTRKSGGGIAAIREA